MERQYDGGAGATAGTGSSGHDAREARMAGTGSGRQDRVTV